MKIEFTIKDCDSGKRYAFNGEGETFGDALENTELAVVYGRDFSVMAAANWLRVEFPKLTGLTIEEGVVAEFINYMCK